MPKKAGQVLYDKDIREPLFEYFEKQYYKVRIMEEIELKSCRADAVMVLPDKLVGIEIKSDADNYSRLGGQIKGYNKFCDLNYVVIGSSHTKGIHNHVPEWWGIISVEQIGDEIKLSLIREAKNNPDVKLEFKLKLLWRSELAHIQKRLGMPKYAGKGKDFVRKKMIERASASVLHQEISEELFERNYTVYK